MSRGLNSEVRQALSTLARHGFLGPTEEPACWSIGTLAERLEIGQTKARAIATELRRTVLLPGNDLRVRVSEVEEFLRNHEVSRLRVEGKEELVS